MEKFTEDLNIIRSLPDNPALTSDEFRSKFDEAGKKIKEYINSILGPEVESKAGEEELRILSTNLNTRIDTALEELEDSVNGAIEGLNSNIGNLSGDVAKKTTYSDFVVETKSIHYVRTQSQGGALSATYTKDGYKPLGIVGQYYTNVYGGSANGARITSLTETSISVEGFVSRGNTGGTTEGDLILSILWVKKN
jgi:hypothetical protein